MTSRRAWIEAAERVVADARVQLAHFGVTPAPDLRVVDEPHPCPGYVHETRTIGFCAPVVERPLDAARWIFFSRMMGCTSVDEAARVYRLALPFIVCHELAHHLRTTHEATTPSRFVEEQACDYLACALVESMPDQRATLTTLGEACGPPIERLHATFAGGPGASFLPDVADVLVATNAIGRLDRDRLEALAAQHDIGLEELLALLPGVDSARVNRATAERDRACAHIDSHYAQNPAEYWYFGLTWVRGYLAHAARPTLAEALQANLFAPVEERREPEVDAALRRMLGVPSQREAAAEGLLVRRGSAAVPELCTLARDADDVLATLARRWPRAAGWDAAPLAPLLAGSARENTSEERARLLVRLAGKVGAPIPPVRSPPRSEALAIEFATARRASPEACASFFRDASSLALLLDAWEAHARPMEELPRDELVALVQRGPASRLRRALLRIALGSPAPPADLACALAIAELRDASGLADAELAANRDAHATLARFPVLDIRSLASRALPARGGAQWEDFLALLGTLGGAEAVVAPPSGGPIEVELRAAAARADLRGVPTGQDQAVLACADALVSRAEAWLAEARALGVPPGHGHPSPSSLAVELVDFSTRLAAVEVARSLAPAATRARIGELAGDACGRAPPDEIVRALMLDRLPPPWPARLGPLVGGPRLAALSAPVARASLPWLAHALLSAAHLPEDPMIGTVERMVHLRGVELFASVPLEHLHGIAELAVPMRFDAGDAIFREGDAGSELYLVVEGKVAIEKDAGGEVGTLALVGPSGCFGEMSLFDGAPRSATARAQTRCHLLVLSRAVLVRLARDAPEVYECFLRVLCARLRRANSGLALLVTDPCSLV
jgi:hypothetical protein